MDRACIMHQLHSFRFTSKRVNTYHDCTTRFQAGNCIILFTRRRLHISVDRSHTITRKCSPKDAHPQRWNTYHNLSSFSFIFEFGHTTQTPYFRSPESHKHMEALLLKVLYYLISTSQSCHLDYMAHKIPQEHRNQIPRLPDSVPRETRA